MPTSDSTGSAGPLAPLLVTDLSRVLSGPLAGMILGDLGARVIKIERRGSGDDTRSWGPPFVSGDGEPESTYFLALNRNKESLELDFGESGDVDLLRTLIRRSDVVIENFRPHVLARLGLSPEEMLTLNPRLVVLSISGFGHRGADADRPGYDQIVQGEAGLMSLTGETGGTPTKVGIPIADIQAGMFGAIGVLAALRERDRTGRGTIVRTSLLSALIGSQTFQATRWLIGNEVPGATGNHHPTVAPYGAYACADGQLQIAVGNDAAWRRFAPLVSIDPDDPRFATNRDRIAEAARLQPLLRARFAEQPVHYWLDVLRRAGVPAGRIRTVDEVYESAAVRDSGLVMSVDHASLGTIRLPGLPYEFDTGGRAAHRPPPTLGQHSASLRSWLSGEEDHD